MSYIGVPPFGNTVRSVTNETATASQTTFNITGGYVPGYVDVFLNGVLLIPGTDFTATNGTTVVLTVGATAGDEFQALSYQTISFTDAYTQTQVDDLLDAKQNTLVSGTNLKTINSTSLLGSGDVSVATSAQGSLADSAVQPGDNVSDLTNDAGYLTTLSTTNWTITESGGVLYFAYSGTNKAKLDSSGNLTVVGDVTAYGSV
jgi:hypothetical protein